MKFIKELEAFLVNAVNLNQARLDKLEGHVSAVESFIEDNQTFSGLFLGLVPAGSWAHRTIIRPVQEGIEFDADVLVSLKENPAWKPCDYIENLYAEYRASETYREKVSRKTRCVRISYAGDFHIDAVPYVGRLGQTWITNRLEPDGVGAFERSNPEQFTAWLDDRQRWSSGQFVHTIRLLKYLRDFKRTFTCKSIILTTLVGQLLSSNDAQNAVGEFSDLSSAFVTLLNRLAKSLPATMPAVIDPGGSGDNFSERYKGDWDYDNFRTRVQDYAAKASSAAGAGDRAQSLAQWQAILGDDFGKFVKSDQEDTVAGLSASNPHAGEQQIEQAPFWHPIELNRTYRARLVGRCVGFSSGGRKLRNGFREFDLPTDGNRVPKNRSLAFRVETNVPRPFRAFWKVRNGGAEAQTQGQLRGEIKEDEGTLTKTETTLYKGTHYVEFYIVKDGKVVARDRQTVIVT